MSAPAISTLEPRTLREWVDNGDDLVVIDVRSAAEFESLHIRGSYNVPLQLLNEHADELAARLGERVVLVCQSGVRAEQARQRLNIAGIGHAYVLSGGANGYAQAGGGVVRGAQRWDLERQVRLAAGSLVVLGLLGGKLISPRLRVLTGAIGAGLTFSALSNTCAMGRALSAMPWNRTTEDPDAHTVIARIPDQSS